MILLQYSRTYIVNTQTIRAHSNILALTLFALTYVCYTLHSPIYATLYTHLCMLHSALTYVCYTLHSPMYATLCTHLCMQLSALTYAARCTHLCSTMHSPMQHVYEVEHAVEYGHEQVCAAEVHQEVVCDGAHAPMCWAKERHMHVKFASYGIMVMR